MITQSCGFEILLFCISQSSFAYCCCYQQQRSHTLNMAASMRLTGSCLHQCKRPALHSSRWQSSFTNLTLRPTRCSIPRTQRRPVKGFHISAQQEQQAAPVAIDPARQAELVKGCRTVLAELQGLDFSKNEVRLYLAAAAKPPKSLPATASKDMTSARAVLDQLLKVDEDGDPLPASRFNDIPGLTLTQAMLSDLWRWRRRGGGMDNDEGGERPHEAALREIQNFSPEDIDRVTSSLLDNLPVSDKEKQAMSGGVQQLAVGAFQGAVWSSLLMCFAFLILFNFLRGV